MRTAQPAIRKAVPADAGQIRAMQEGSLRVLGRGFYSPEQIERFIELVGTLDEALLDEGHYFVAVDDGREIIGSGGWSVLKPGYAVTMEQYEHGGEATVRSVYVAPSASRRGVGSAIMRRIETDAAGAGIDRLRLMATLSGVPFYDRLGYRQGGRRDMALGAGLSLGCIEMEKRLRTEAEAA